MGAFKMVKIDHKDLDMLVKDCLMHIGMPDWTTTKEMKTIGDTKNHPHKRLLPGSETFADMYHHNFKKIDDLPDLKAQMDFIKANESFQWPAWMTDKKHKYMELIGQ